ncbi:NAD(P)/FAD-dependent oxidoreductase [Salegentibacter flavus]|uniref:Sulfide:quinone oxidoreductase n=1 Tax=Salegentibacter flavus TaxID=287099 RepID=A0A1I5BPG8_9FLAO|nr:FAD/NAD(P)-binding oxidoreductase [Salegentibacter flavus]SFN76674.1 sulfide:quinone oxidoreductase [Salegentibacter flavus]
MNSKHQILVIGAGTGGLMMASRLKKEHKDFDIAIIDPAKTHYYQPAWTLVGAGTYDFEDTAKPMADLIPKGVKWYQDKVTAMDPDSNSVSTEKSGEIKYDYLVVSPGLTYDMSLVPGLSEAIDKGNVCSNYTDPKHTLEVLKNFKGGTALFTQPTTPIKCGGAPQKIMYLAEAYFKKHGLKDKTNVVFATNGTVIFAVPEIKETLMKIVDRKNINLKFYHALKRIDAEKQIAWYELAPEAYEHNPAKLEIEKEGNMVGIHYDMLHLAPPSVAPEFVRKSKLANAEGWLDVDHHSLQHNKYPNVFGLGDVAALPTAKTGAAIRKQVPVVLDNIEKLMKNQAADNKKYNGYSSCPLVTEYGKMVLAEFDYDNKFTPDPELKKMLIFDSSKEHWRLWILKKYGLPYLYWNKMLKGQDV